MLYGPGLIKSHVSNVFLLLVREATGNPCVSCGMYTFIIDSLQITVVGIKVAGAIASQIVIVYLLLIKDFNNLVILGINGYNNNNYYILCVDISVIKP